MTSAKKITPKDLIVIDYKTQTSPHKTLMRWQEEQGLFVAQSCSRQTFMGITSDLGNIPIQEQPNKSLKIYRGTDAYRYLLELITGNDPTPEELDNIEKLGENHVVSQLKTAWKKFQEAYPDKSSIMQPVWDSLIADMRYIRKNISSELRPNRMENAVRNLSGQQPDEKVIIIGKRAKNLNTANNQTIQLVRLLGAKSTRRVKEILITHPIDERAEVIYKHIKQEQSEGKIHPDIKLTLVPLQQVLSHEMNSPMMKSQRVYIAYPMGQDDAVDQQIIESWKNNSSINNSSTLTHIAGSRELQGGTTQAWQELQSFCNDDSETKRVFTFTDVKEAQKECTERMKAISADVKQAAENCAITRCKHGKTPIYRNITRPTDEYLTESGLTRTGMLRSTKAT